MTYRYELYSAVEDFQKVSTHLMRTTRDKQDDRVHAVPTQSKNASARRRVNAIIHEKQS